MSFKNVNLAKKIHWVFYITQDKGEEKFQLEMKIQSKLVLLLLGEEFDRKASGREDLKETVIVSSLPTTVIGVERYLSGEAVKQET